MMQIRQRYLVFEILTPINSQLLEKSVLRSFWNKIQYIFGENKSFKAGLWMIVWDYQNLKGILRCDHLMNSEVICALSMLTSIDKIPVIVHCRKTTGTIKKAKKIWRDEFGIPIPEKENQNY